MSYRLKATLCAADEGRTPDDFLLWLLPRHSEYERTQLLARATLGCTPLNEIEYLPGSGELSVLLEDHQEDAVASQKYAGIPPGVMRVCCIGLMQKLQGLSLLQNMRLQTGAGRSG